MSRLHWESIIQDVCEVTLYDEKDNTVWFGEHTIKVHLLKNRKEGKYYVSVQVATLDSEGLNLLAQEKIKDAYYFKNDFNRQDGVKYKIKLRTIAYDLDTAQVTHDFYVYANNARLNQSIELPFEVGEVLNPTLVFALEEDENGYAFNINPVERDPNKRY